MSQERNIRPLLELQKELLKELGDGTAVMAEDIPTVEGLSTGILSLDVALGIGGLPIGAISTVFGAPDIGKSSVLGIGLVRSAQALGQNAVWITTEHKFNKEWAARHGLDNKRLLIVYPENGEDAFHALYKAAQVESLGVIVFDSIGALLNESEIEGTDKSDAKIKMGGRANLISWGTHRILGSIRRNRIAVLYINQQRQIMDPNAKGAMQMPGGEVLKHMSWVIIQMKNGENSSRVTVKMQDGDKYSDVEIGREIVAVVNRTQVTDGSKMRAPFMFYNKQVEGYPFGVDVTQDLLNTGKRLGVITGTNWLEIPGVDQKINGKNALKQYLDENPAEGERIRKLVMEKVGG